MIDEIIVNNLIEWQFGSITTPALVQWILCQTHLQRRPSRHLSDVIDVTDVTDVTNGAEGGRYTRSRSPSPPFQCIQEHSKTWLLNYRRSLPGRNSRTACHVWLHHPAGCQSALGFFYDINDVVESVARSLLFYLCHAARSERSNQPLQLQSNVSLQLCYLILFILCTNNMSIDCSLYLKLFE